MHEGPTENRLGELGSLYKYYYYYYIIITVTVAVVVAVAVTVAVTVTVVVVVVVVVVAALSDPILFLPEKWKREEGRRAHFPGGGWQPSLAPYLCHCEQPTW